MADDDEERRHLSPDSSTQVLPRSKHKHKKKKKHKHKSKKRKRKHSDADRESSDDERVSTSSPGSVGQLGHMDDDGKVVEKNELVLDIKPLTEYLEDRKALNNELFKIMARKEMKKLMPKSVKKLDVDELRSRCLDQLEVISKKRLLKVIEGREMSSSSSESEREDNSKNSIPKDTDQQIVVVSSNLPAASEIQDEPMNILEELSLVPDQDEINELIEGATATEGPTVDDTAGQESPKGSVVDTEYQLLELEFRARALKSMVQAHQRFKT